MNRLAPLLSLVLFLLPACAAQVGSGTLNIAASGEAAAVDGYPSSAGVAFVDGWTLHWDFVLISISSFYVHHSGSGPTLEADQVVINLHDAVLQDVWSFPALPAQRYEDIGYQILPATMSARRVGTVTDANLMAMSSGGIAYWLHGTAHYTGSGAARHDVVLDLRIPMHTSMTACMNAMDMTEGLVVAPNGMTNLQVTFHLDHVFFDSIVNPEPPIRFEAYAGAAGSDFMVTFDELSAQPLANLHDIDGSPLTDAMGTPIVYDPGSTPLGHQDLRSFVYHQATTVGHFNGEGHCTYVCVGPTGAVQPSCPAP